MDGKWRSATPCLLLPLLLATGMSLPIALPAAAQPDAVAVIVHSSNQESRLSRRDIRGYLVLEENTWPDEKPITVYTPKSGKAKELMLRVVYELSNASELRDLLDRKTTSNQGTVREYSTDREIKEKVKNNPGAIGYISAEEVDEDDTVAALIVDGKKFTSVQYPLRIPE